MLANTYWRLTKCRLLFYALYLCQLLLFFQTVALWDNNYYYFSPSTDKVREPYLKVRGKEAGLGWGAASERQSRLSSQVAAEFMLSVT